MGCHYWSQAQAEQFCRVCVPDPFWYLQEILLGWTKNPVFQIQPLVIRTACHLDGCKVPKSKLSNCENGFQRFHKWSWALIVKSPKWNRDPFSSYRNNWYGSWEINLKPASSPPSPVKEDSAESFLPQSRSAPAGVLSTCSFDGEEKPHTIIAIFWLWRRGTEHSLQKLNCQELSYAPFLPQRRRHHCHPPLLKCKAGTFYQFCVFTADRAIKHLKFASFLSFNHSRALRKLLYQLAKPEHSTSHLTATLYWYIVHIVWDKGGLLKKWTNIHKSHHALTGWFILCSTPLSSVVGPVRWQRCIGKYKD